MLKHCSPSTVDVSRRSRRNLFDCEEDDAASHRSPKSNPDSLSLNSCSAASTSSSSSSSARSSGRSSCRSPLYKDAATSPKSTYSRKRLIAKQRSVSVDATGGSAGGPGSVPIKVYARCLRSDIEYKTLSVTPQTTSRELIWILLGKFRMKHRDPNLFYLTMDISIRRTGIPLKRSLSLDDDSRPVELKSCHPWGECKFTLQMRKGGVVRVYDSVLMAESKYKCLLISESTTAEEVIKILFRCYGMSTERVSRFCVVEQDVSTGLERRMASEERPVLVQSTWMEEKVVMRFVLKKMKSCSTSDGDRLDACYSSGESETGSSEYSALRFRESPVSASTRSSDSAVSGLLKSSPEEVDAATSPIPPQSRPPPPPPPPHLYLKRGQQNRPKGSGSHCKVTTTTLVHSSQPADSGNLVPPAGGLSRQISLHSLLEALPAASVDNDSSSEVAAAAPASSSSTAVVAVGAATSRNCGKQRASLSSLSLDSRSSDYDSYFYI